MLHVPFGGVCQLRNPRLSGLLGAFAALRQIRSSPQQQVPARGESSCVICRGSVVMAAWDAPLCPCQRWAVRYAASGHCNSHLLLFAADLSTRPVRPQEQEWRSPPLRPSGHHRRPCFVGWRGTGRCQLLHKAFLTQATVQAYCWRFSHADGRQELLRLYAAHCAADMPARRDNAPWEPPMRSALRKMWGPGLSIDVTAGETRREVIHLSRWRPPNAGAHAYSSPTLTTRVAVRVERQGLRALVTFEAQHCFRNNLGFSVLCRVSLVSSCALPY